MSALCTQKLLVLPNSALLNLPCPLHPTTMTSHLSSCAFFTTCSPGLPSNVQNFPCFWKWMGQNKFILNNAVMRLACLKYFFDDRQLSSCWLRYKITYLNVSSFKMFHSELFWRLFAWTSMATSVSGASSKTVWRHAIEWRHDSRTCSTMTSYFSRRFFLQFLAERVYLSQCMTKGGLWHDVILMRKEHYDVIVVYFSICTKSKSFEQWKINVIDE